MHSDLHIGGDLDLAALEALRNQLRLTQAEVCRQLDINPATYQRWLKHIRGEPGGVCPQRRSLKALRRLLVTEREALLNNLVHRSVQPSDRTRPAA